MSEVLWELARAITEPDDEPVTWGALKGKIERAARRVESHESERRMRGEDM